MLHQRSAVLKYKRGSDVFLRRCQQLGEAAFAAGNFERAAKILDAITTADAFETFLTLPAYRAID